MAIFKGVRMNERLAETPMPSLVRLSPKGWINVDLFAGWFQHFIGCIPSHNPVVFFIHSHASHIIREIFSKASDNGTHFVTFPISYYTSIAATGYWCLQATDGRLEERSGEVFD